MSYDNGVSFPETKDHYHSTKCKTCIHCQLCAEFPRPWENKIDEPLNYYQEYAPQCVGCAYWDEWKTKGPLNEIHVRLAMKDIHDKIEEALGNITSSCVARTRPIKSESRLLTDWQTEILELMEANGVPEENIGKVLDLL